jgi:3-mercaptopyruvate sulfurtransferase SseA
VGDSDGLRRLAGVGGSFIQAHFASCLPGSSECLVAKLSTGLPYELLGYPNVRSYDGSWTMWGSLVAAPVATGA